MLRYNAQEIADKLESLYPAQGLTVAAACAEKLLRSFGGEIPHAAIGGGFLQSVLNKLWDSAASDNGYPGDPTGDLQVLSDVLSGNYGEELGVGEHVILGLYYSVEAARAVDARKAELVTSNLYEAADYKAVADADFDISEQGAEERILASTPVQDALSFISRVLVLSSEFPDNSQRVAEVRRIVADLSG